VLKDFEIASDEALQEDRAMPAAPSYVPPSGSEPPNQSLVDRMNSQIDAHKAAISGTAARTKEEIRREVADRKRGKSRESMPRDVMLEDESSIIHALNERYERLNALWRKAEAELRRFPVPSTVRILLRSFSDPEDPEAEMRGFQVHEFMAWHRCESEWRICFGTRDDRIPDHLDSFGWKPVTDCSLSVRNELAPLFGKLKSEVVAAAKATIPKLDSSISTLESQLS
jgi:hypothetical protein